MPDDRRKGVLGGDITPFILAAGAGVAGAWFWWRRNRQPLPTSTTMSGRVCVVTGANAGIGKATATALAQKGAHVVLACRNDQKAAAACNDIRLKVPGAAVQALPLDLSSVESIRGFVQLFHKTGLPLHVLVNNAGIILGEPAVVRDMEKSMVVNHLGPFLLTQLLLPDLRKSAAVDGRGDDEGEGGGRRRGGAASRIIHVGSRLEKRGSLWAAAAGVPPGARWFHPPPGKTKHEAFPLYASSKLCGQLCAFELDRRLAAQDQVAAAAAAATRAGGGGTPGRRTVTSNVVTPGVVNTGLGDGTVSPWLLWAAPFLRGALMRTVEKGAETVVWAASAPEIGETGGGKFLGDLAEVPSSDDSRDEGLAKMVWEASELASGLEESERMV